MRENCTHVATKPTDLVRVTEKAAFFEKKSIKRVSKPFYPRWLRNARGWRLRRKLRIRSNKYRINFLFSKKKFSDDFSKIRVFNPIFKNCSFSKLIICKHFDLTVSPSHTIPAKTFSFGIYR